jgi:prepilin-type N-terminal cleavage/methylation domain-containing protein
MTGKSIFLAFGKIYTIMQWNEARIYFYHISMDDNKLTSPTQPNMRRYKGFTLVELIVVITILAILGTIGFLSI